MTLLGPPSPDYFCAQETAPKENYVQNWTLVYIESFQGTLTHFNLKNHATIPETLKFYQSKKMSMKKF